VARTRAAIPFPALAYGLAGLIPFLAGAGAIALHRLSSLAVLPLEALYGAVILSFLGGARWGIEIRREAPRFGVITLTMAPSVVGFLTAGVAVTAGADNSVVGAGCLVQLAVMFLIHWLWDVTAKEAPDWYPRLRSILTLVAVASLIYCAFGVFSL